MFFRDVCAWYGPVRTPAAGVLYGLEALKKRMDDFQIEKALVYHSLAREYDPNAGNEILINDIKGDSRLLPVFALLPPETGEMPAPGKLLKNLEAQGVRAVTFFPGEQLFSLRRWSAGPLMDALAECRIPVLLGLDQFGGHLDALGETALQYPALRLIITGVNFRCDRMLYPLMNALPNLCIETSAYKPFRGIEETCRRFGASRLLFGSGSPQTDPAASAALITCAEISQNDKVLIASRNLERLLSEAYT